MVSPNKFIVPDIQPASFIIEILDSEQKPRPAGVTFEVIIDGKKAETKETDNEGILRLPKPQNEIKLSLIGELISSPRTKSAKAIKKGKMPATLLSSTDTSPEHTDPSSTMGEVTIPQPWHINPNAEMLYLDAGAWQGHEDGTFWTNFVLISGNGVALCNYYKAPANSESNADYLKDLEAKGEGEFKGCEPILDFLKSIDSKKPLSHLLSFHRSISKPFWDNNSMLCVIGDMHLHLFRQLDGKKEELRDNFIKIENGERKSLERDFCEFLNKISVYKQGNLNIEVKVVQAGDILDIWEIEYGIYKLYFEEIYHGLVDLEVEKIFTDLSNEGVLSSIHPPIVNDYKHYKPLYEYIQNNIFSPIFHSINKLKSQKIDFEILGGNHDDALANPTEFDDGPDYLVHIEHGHRFDKHNKPGDDFVGRLCTKLNVDFEERRLGDWFKSKEYYFDPLSDQRERYIKASLEVGSWFVNNKNKNLSVFLMAHTHEPYAKKLPRPLGKFEQ